MAIYNRKIISDLEKWSVSNNRKPLILRGARQVGKSTVIDISLRNSHILGENIN